MRSTWKPSAGIASKNLLKTGLDQDWTRARQPESQGAWHQGARRPQEMATGLAAVSASPAQLACGYR